MNDRCTIDMTAKRTIQNNKRDLSFGGSEEVGTVWYSYHRYAMLMLRPRSTIQPPSDLLTTSKYRFKFQAAKSEHAASVEPLL
jgi:hypothetical protein